MEENHRATLLEERLFVAVSAKVKGEEKNYTWIAKVLSSESIQANFARFQVRTHTNLIYCNGDSEVALSPHYARTIVTRGFRKVKLDSIGS